MLRKLGKALATLHTEAKDEASKSAVVLMKSLVEPKVVEEERCYWCQGYGHRYRDCTTVKELKRVMVKSGGGDEVFAMLGETVGKVFLKKRGLYKVKGAKKGWGR